MVKATRYAVILVGRGELTSRPLDGGFLCCRKNISNENWGTVTDCIGKQASRFI